MTTGRVGFIVDHPMRDLDGLVLVACELATRGVEVFLVPMYHRHELFLLRPDVVVANYARFANAAFLEACRRLGMRTAILDTEGGVQQDLAQYAARAAVYLRTIDLYCVWGRRQREALMPFARDSGTTVVETGSPRYDFTAAPWRRAIRPVGAVGDRFVLVNTTFPILGPRFQSQDREVRQLVDGIGYDATFIEQFVAQSHRARDELVAATRALGQRFPASRIVVRPHPFEDKGHYEREFTGLSNVDVIQAGTVFEWIAQAVAVVHYNCSTAVDAVLMGCEPINLSWINAPLLHQPISLAVTQEARSIAELEALVGVRLEGGELPVSPEVVRRRGDVIRDFFCGADASCARRVADAVAGLLPSARATENRWLYAAKTVRVQSGVRPRIQQALALMAGPAAYARVRRWAGQTRLDPAKAFSAADVGATVERLAATHSPYNALFAGEVHRRKAFLPVRWTYRSVMVTAAGSAHGR